MLAVDFVSDIGSELNASLSSVFWFSEVGSGFITSFSLVDILLEDSFTLLIPKSSLPIAKNAIPKIKNAAIAINGNMWSLYTPYIYILTFKFFTLKDLKIYIDVILNDRFISLHTIPSLKNM